jgi:hypothetical protein
MESKPQKDNSRIILAFVLIGVGILWILRRIGFYIDLPDIHLHNIFYPIRQFFHGWGHFIFSWQMVLIIVGLVLLAGKRPLGIVFFIIGGVFILPKLFYFPGFTFSLIFPVLLIGIGLAMVVKRI